MVRVIVVVVHAAIPVRGRADPAPRPFVAVEERDAVDRIVQRNRGVCALASGHLVLDMRASRGGVVIETAVGGRGTKDVWPVRGVTGPVRLAQPGADGTQRRALTLDRLATGARARITLDVDNERAWFRAGRVSIRPGDLRDSRAIFTPRVRGANGCRLRRWRRGQPASAASSFSWAASQRVSARSSPSMTSAYLRFQVSSSLACAAS